MPLLVWFFFSLFLYLNHLFYSIFMLDFKLCYRLLSVIPIFFLCLFTFNMLYYIQEKGIYAMPSLTWLSIAFILYLNHLFYSIFMIDFKVCYRLLSVIPIFFLCLFSFNMLYYIQEKGIHAMPSLTWLSIAFILYLNHLFYSIFMLDFKLCYRLLSVIPIFFLCLFSLNMLYYIQEKGIYAMPKLVWLSIAFILYLNHLFYSN